MRAPEGTDTGAVPLRSPPHRRLPRPACTVGTGGEGAHRSPDQPETCMSVGTLLLLVLGLHAKAQVTELAGHCPMPTAVRQGRPGVRPWCGMSLEQAAPAIGDARRKEFTGFQRRFCRILPLIWVVNALAMSEHRLALIDRRGPGCTEVAITMPMVRWAGWPMGDTRPSTSKLLRRSSRWQCWVRHWHAGRGRGALRPRGHQPRSAKDAVPLLASQPRLRQGTPAGAGPRGGARPENKLEMAPTMCTRACRRGPRGSGDISPAPGMVRCH